MIQMLDQLEPATKLSWGAYTPSAQIDWLHGEKRQLISQDQVIPSSGPASVIPSAVFSLVTYPWEVVGW